MLTKVRWTPTRLVLAAALVTGCAPVTSPSAGADHPASASAPETPRPAPSRALAGELGGPVSNAAASRTHDIHVHGGE
jgi:hypothetical protein